MSAEPKPVNVVNLRVVDRTGGDAPATGAASKRRMQWSKWHWDDWARDPGLRASSYAAKGLWMDLLCQMDASRERGFLLIGDRVPTGAEIARMVGGEARAVVRLMRELEANGVFSRDSRGAIFCRRMVRDCADLQQNIADGRLGGNPVLMKNKDLAEKRVNPPDKAETDTEIEKERKREKRRGVPLSVASPAEVISPPAEAGLPSAHTLRQAAEFTVGRPASTITAEQVNAAFDAWNVMARQCQVVQAIEFSNFRQIGIADTLAKRGLSVWQQMLDRVAVSQFLNGANDRGWVADLEFLLKPTNQTALLEGRYDNRASSSPPKQPALSRTSVNRLHYMERAFGQQSSQAGAYQPEITTDEEGHIHVGPPIGS